MSLRRIGSALSLLLLSLSATAVFAADAKTAPAAPITAERYGTWGFDLQGMDRTVKPGDDFFKYVNGAWLAKTQIPADKTAYGAFAVLGDLSEARVHALLDKWAADKSLKAGSDEAKVAAVYRTFLDDEGPDLRRRGPADGPLRRRLRQLVLQRRHR
jgi:putative endopeptidase